MLYFTFYVIQNQTKIENDGNIEGVMKTTELASKIWIGRKWAVNAHFRRTDTSISIFVVLFHEGLSFQVKNVMNQ